MSSPSRRFSVRGRASPKGAISRKLVFDVKSFLESNGLRRKIVKVRRRETFFSQGDFGKNVMYLHEGAVKLSVVNQTGKEAVVEILGPGDFFGVRCLTGNSVYTSTATAIVPTTVFAIEKNELTRVLHREHAFSDAFMANILARSGREEEALIDQLFNSSEKRLARTLLLLARYEAPGHPQTVIPKVSQETLAEMIGATRARVNFFMTKFRKLGFIKYNRDIHVNKSLLSVFLRN